MNALFAKSLATCVAVLLALPTGWCCVLPQRQAEASSKADSHCPACCSKTTDRDDASRDEPPAPQQAESCCCHPAVAIPANGAKPVLDPDLVLPLPEVSNQAAIATFISPAASALLDTGPPLRLLHCVWRC